MKKRILLCSLLMPVLALAQSYSIDWHKVAGGGGSSSNGQFSLSGTIGQLDASATGALTGGGFSLTGGFWSLISVVQTPGAPTLTITHPGSSVVVSWPSSATGFVLQQNANVATTNWATSGYSITTNGTMQSITIPSPSGSLFFRLFQ